MKGIYMKNITWAWCGNGKKRYKCEFYSYDLYDAVSLAKASALEHPETVYDRADFHITDIKRYPNWRKYSKFISNLKKLKIAAKKFLERQNKL